MRGTGTFIVAPLIAAIGCRTIPPEDFDALHRIQMAMAQARKEYVIQAGDTLQINVYRGGQIAPEYKQEVTVQPDGRINLINQPDAVKAEGLSPEQLQKRIKELYTPLFVTEGAPAKFEVTAQLLTSTKTQWLPDQVFVTGQVRRPKAMPYRKGYTVMKAITEAEGWIYAANESKTVILRSSPEGKTVARQIDLAAVALYEAEDIELMPGDVVFVPLSFIARVNLFIDFYIRGLIPINPSVIRSFVAL